MQFGEKEIWGSYSVASFVSEAAGVNSMGQPCGITVIALQWSYKSPDWTSPALRVQLARNRSLSTS